MAGFGYIFNPTLTNLPSLDYQKGEGAPTQYATEIIPRLEQATMRSPIRTFMQNNCGYKRFLFQILFRNLKFQNQFFPSLVIRIIIVLVNDKPMRGQFRSFLVFYHLQISLIKE